MGTDLVYHENTSRDTQYLGGHVIRPGEGRLIARCWLPQQAHEQPDPAAADSDPAPAPAPAFSCEQILGGTVAEAKAALPGLSVAELAELQAFEADNANRRTLIEAIRAEQLARAAAAAEESGA